MKGYGSIPHNRLTQRLLAILLGCILSTLPIGSAQSLPTPAKPTAPSTSIQPYIDRVRQRVTQFSLPNGITFIVLERHEAPVVSFVTYANVGAADEAPGQTGIAHFLEHLAFKGTQRIGTRNYAAEAPVLDELDQIFAKLQAARRAQQVPNPSRDDANSLRAQIKTLTAQFEALKTRAGKLVNQNELGQVIEQSGGVGLNAATSMDSTVYFYSLPANKLELWMSLESARFLQPVFREFYEEKEIILEERRMSLENEPVSELFTAVQAAAFAGQAYEHPTIGYREDIRNLSRRDVADFFAKYYGPQNLTMAIVGDVDPAQVKRMAEAYFGGFKASRQPVATPIAAQPVQVKPVAPIVLERDNQPVYIEAYRIPDIRSPDYLISQILSSILSDGRTSRLYRRMVEGDRTATTAAGFTGYPGDKQANLMMLYALPIAQDLDALARSIASELDRLKTDPVPAAELDRIKTQARASVLRALSSNEGMAQALAEYAVKTGRWQSLFEELDAIDRITPTDLQRVAKQIFRPENRIIGRLVQPKTSPKPTAPAPPK